MSSVQCACFFLFFCRYILFLLLLLLQFLPFFSKKSPFFLRALNDCIYFFKLPVWIIENSNSDSVCPENQNRWRVCFKYPWIMEVHCHWLYLWIENSKVQKPSQKKQWEKKQYGPEAAVEDGGGGGKKWWYRSIFWNRSNGKNDRTIRANGREWQT